MNSEQKANIYSEAIHYLLTHSSLKNFDWDDDSFTCSEQEFYAFLETEKGNIERDVEILKENILVLCDRFH